MMMMMMMMVAMMMMTMLMIMSMPMILIEMIMIIMMILSMMMMMRMMTMLMMRMIAMMMMMIFIIMMIMLIIMMLTMMMMMMRMMMLMMFMMTNACTMDHRPSIREGQSISGLVVGYISPDDVTRALLPHPSSFFLCRLPGNRVRFKLSSPRHQIRAITVNSVSAWHAEDPGSISGRGVFHSSHVAYEPMRPASFAPFARTSKPSRRLKQAILIPPPTSCGAKAHAV
jgi:hypothetical protein